MHLLWLSRNLVVVGLVFFLEKVVAVRVLLRWPKNFVQSKTDLTTHSSIESHIYSHKLSGDLVKRLAVAIVVQRNREFTRNNSL